MFEKIKVKCQVILKSIEANLKVDQSMKKLPIGTLGLIYMCYMAHMCDNQIDVPNDDDADPIIKDWYLGCFSGETKKIQFDQV